MKQSVLDSIQVPHEFVELCSRWYDGAGSMMHAIASTGNLSRGSIRPTEQEGFWETPTRYISSCRELTDLEWHRSLFSQLSSEIACSIESAEKSDDLDVASDIGELHNFDAWADRIIDAIDSEIESTESEVA